jgi:hypothetical protein
LAVSLAKLPREDLAKFFDVTLQNLYRFLDNYITIHRNPTPLSERARMLLDNMEKRLVQVV